MKWEARLFWALLAALWFWFAGGAIGAHFSTDDSNNLFTYWTMGWAGLLKANLLFFSGAYRPMGGVVYYGLYSLFGLDITPFRVTCLALILVNGWLLYRVAGEVLQDRYAAAAATALGSVHPALWLIYYSNGTLFDILCYVFYLAALLVYMRDGRPVWVLLLFAAALNSKEMAVTLPLVCALWDWRRKKLLAAMALMTAAYAVGKASSSLAAAAAYHPVVTWDRYLETSRSLVGHITGLPFSSAMVLALYGLMTAHMLASRSRPLATAWAIAILGFLPLNFITPREPFVVYLPLCGWTLYLVASMCQAKLSGRWLTIAALALVVASCARSKSGQIDVIGAQQPMWNLLQSLRAANFQPPPNSCVLLTADPFYPDWDTYFVGKLQLNDRTVRVNVAGPNGEIRGDECTPTGYELVMESGRVVRWEKASSQPVVQTPTPR